MVPAAFLPSPCLWKAVPEVPVVNPPTDRRRRWMMMMTMTSSSSADIEVEEKFALPPDGSWSSVENKLMQLGFVPRSGGTIKFTDTYYDLAAPNWCLTPRDCWLRFRGQRINEADSSSPTLWRGEWQLKVRRENIHDVGAATAYEEVEGDEALKRASEVLADAAVSHVKNRDDSKDQLLEGAPEAPDGLVPFAQFETSRSSWIVSNDAKSSSEYVGLTVDIDATDFGYGVGEVEALLKKEDDMADTRKRIGKLVEQISGAIANKNDDLSVSPHLPPLGKLETYLLERSRDHYETIIAAGIFKTV